MLSVLLDLFLGGSDFLFTEAHFLKVLTVDWIHLAVRRCLKGNIGFTSPIEGEKNVPYDEGHEGRAINNEAMASG